MFKCLSPKAKRLWDSIENKWDFFHRQRSENDPKLNLITDYKMVISVTSLINMGGMTIFCGHYHKQSIKKKANGHCLKL